MIKPVLALCGREKVLPEVSHVSLTHRAALADEPGCLQFEIGRDVDEHDVFHLYEVYRDEAALARHRSAPHFERWRQASGDLLVERGRTTRMSQLVVLGGDKPKEASS